MSMPEFTRSDTPPFLGYRLSADVAGVIKLEGAGLLATDPPNDMDALVFEQLLRMHTGEWIPAISLPESA